MSNAFVAQSALDLTGYGGRVVLGSWYGGGAAQLNLGMAFHRSHLTIQTSQASLHEMRGGAYFHAGFSK